MFGALTGTVLKVLVVEEAAKKIIEKVTED